jgi:hypothetical protein
VREDKYSRITPATAEDDVEFLQPKRSIMKPSPPAEQNG